MVKSIHMAKLALKTRNKFIAFYEFYGYLVYKLKRIVSSIIFYRSSLK